MQTGTLVPEFEFNMLNGPPLQSRNTGSFKFRLLVIYRGMWCPHCKAQLQDLNRLWQSFNAAGVVPVAASADTKARAETSLQDYGLDQVRLGYDMPIPAARDLGAFISAGINAREMPLFCEPASFLINADNRIQAAWIASNAFARTRMDDVRNYIDFLANHSERAPRGSA